MRNLHFYILILFTLIILIHYSIAETSQTEFCKKVETEDYKSPCIKANLLLHQGFLVKAKAEYQTILSKVKDNETKKDEILQCVFIGMNCLSQREYEYANELYKLGLTVEAKTVYKAIFQAVPIHVYCPYSLTFVQQVK